LKEALGEGRQTDGPFPGESFFAALLLATATGICRAEAIEAPPIRRFGETVCEAIDLCGIYRGSSCPDGHVRSVCTATKLDFIDAAAVTVGCRWAETAADTTAVEVGPLGTTENCALLLADNLSCLGERDVLLRFHPLNFFFSEQHRAFP